MNELKEIYNLIKTLRSKGVRMKDIAEQTGMSPSVLSALFTTVLPTFFKNKEKGMGDDEALDNAVVWVNNVSKKKLLASAAKMKETLLNIEPEEVKPETLFSNPFVDKFARVLKGSVGLATDFLGTYMSYSVSSSSDALKIEPYLLTRSSDGSYIEVVHSSAYGSVHKGFAMMNGMNHIYIVFNENRQPQLSLFNICLKVPMYDRPPFLRGLYTCFDYNYNPIARRILFVRQTDESSNAGFSQLKGCLKQPGELSELEQKYYDYTCGKTDVIRMCNVTSPTMTEEDLVTEKEMLGKLKG